MQKTTVARKASRKTPLRIPEYGAKLLRQAIPLLELTDAEKVALKAIACRNEVSTRRKEKEPRRNAATAPPRATLNKAPELAIQ